MGRRKKKRHDHRRSFPSGHFYRKAIDSLDTYKILPRVSKRDLLLIVVIFVAWVMVGVFLVREHMDQERQAVRMQHHDSYQKTTQKVDIPDFLLGDEDGMETLNENDLVDEEIVDTPAKLDESNAPGEIKSDEVVEYKQGAQSIDLMTNPPNKIDLSQSIFNKVKPHEEGMEETPQEIESEISPVETTAPETVEEALTESENTAE